MAAALLATTGVEASPGSRSEAAWRARGKALVAIRRLAVEQGDYEAARTYSEEALAVYRLAGDKMGIASSLRLLATVAYLQGEYDYDRARSLVEESLAIYRELGDKRGMAVTLLSLGVGAHLQGDYDRARALYEESLAIHRELVDKWGIAVLLNNLGNLAYMEGDYDRAHELHIECLSTGREFGSRLGIALSLAGVGEAVIGLGKREGRADWVEKGAVLLGVSDALYKELEAVREREDAMPYEHAMEAARAQLGEERFERLRGEGRAMRIEQAIEYALEQTPEG